MLKAIYYRVNLDYDGITHTIDDFKRSPYYISEGNAFQMGVGENVYIEDCFVYKSIYSALLITKYLSADKNQILADKEAIKTEFINEDLHLRRIEYSPYFSCGYTMIHDDFFVDNTLDIAQKFGLNLNELQGDALISVSDEKAVNIRNQKYIFK